MGGPDDEAECAMANVENAILISRAMIRSGPAKKYCLDCGEAIPEMRRKAVAGCLYCIECQEDHDDHPNVTLLTNML